MAFDAWLGGEALPVGLRVPPVDDRGYVLHFELASTLVEDLSGCCQTKLVLSDSGRHLQLVFLKRPGEPRFDFENGSQ